VIVTSAQGVSSIGSKLVNSVSWVPLPKPLSVPGPQNVCAGQESVGAPAPRPKCAVKVPESEVPESVVAALAEAATARTTATAAASTTMR
jgi:hypothetical protein